MINPLFVELRELETANEQADSWGAAVGARLERIRSLQTQLGVPAKRPAYSVSYTVPAGTHLVSLYHYSHAARGDDKRGYYAHLILQEGWYDDSGQPLLGTSITGGYHPTPQAAIDDAYERVLQHIAKINAEIPLRQERRLESSAPAVRKEADDLLKLLGI